MGMLFLLKLLGLNNFICIWGHAPALTYQKKAWRVNSSQAMLFSDTNGVEPVYAPPIQSKLHSVLLIGFGPPSSYQATYKNNAMHYSFILKRSTDNILKNSRYGCNNNITKTRSISIWISPIAELNSVFNSFVFDIQTN